MNGRYIEMDYQETQMYGDVMAMAVATPAKLPVPTRLAIVIANA